MSWQPSTSAAPPAQVAAEVDYDVIVGTRGPGDATLHAVIYTPVGDPRGGEVLIPGMAYEPRLLFDFQTANGPVSQAEEAAEDGWVAIAVDRPPAQRR